jgi:hypothetical protein
MAKAHRFGAQLQEIGTNRGVAVPAAIGAAFVGRGYAPIVGTVNAHPFRSTLVPAPRGGHYLFLTSAVRTEAGLAVGDDVEIIMEGDPSDSEPPMPDDFAAVLHALYGGNGYWQQAAPHLRKEMLIWIAETADPAGRARRIVRALARVMESSGR